MTEPRIITMGEIQEQATRVARTLTANGWGNPTLFGVPRGGIPAALAVAAVLPFVKLTENVDKADVIIDDIYDSGATYRRYAAVHPKKPFLPLFDKREPPWHRQWLVMPWERSENGDVSATDIITRLLQFIGEDPMREGLKDTPARVLKGWQEWATGYGQKPGDVLKTFEDGANDELVIVHNIPVVSKCEHHLADIIGHAHVGYIPKGKIVGLSKLARVTDIFSRRLQVQERLTAQIADCLMKHLDPVGVGVLVRASHACMSTRGVKVHGSVTTTSAMRGALLTKPEARKEFMDLCAMAERQQVT